jgi:predicted protein tyrosine phosphatase
MKKVLFICSQNKKRSPTAVQEYSTYPNIECNSAWLNSEAENQVILKLVDCGDIIFVKEKAHKNKLRAKFKKNLSKARVICLDIPDEYEYIYPILIKPLELKVSRFQPIS